MAVGLPAYPLSPLRLARLQAAPFARSIGMELITWGAGAASARLRPHDRIATSLTDPRVHPLSLIGMLDDLSAHSIASLVPSDLGMSTVDLRIDLTGEPAEGRVTAETECLSIDQSAAMVRGSVRDSDGKLIAASIACFTLGAFPGQGVIGGEIPGLDIGNFSPEGLQGPFQTLLAITEAEEACRLPPGTRQAIGFEGLPALHGGAIGALLAMACENRVRNLNRPEMRLSSITIRYLKAANDDGVTAVATCERAGRRVMHLNARCFKTEGTDIAQATAVFLPRV